MNKTAVREPLSETTAAATPARKSTSVSPLYKVLKPFASLRLTVWLFTLSIILVFSGTLAQVDGGIWTIMEKYFRTWLVWIPFQVFVRFGQVFFGVSPTTELSGAFPFPGGWLLGGLLLANLLAAHFVRFRMTWKRSGILMIHSGIVVMMLSELIAGLFAVEATMTIAEGESVNFTDVSRTVELAIIDKSDPKTDEVVVIPESFLKKGGTIQNSLLPFEVVVDKYMVNSEVLKSDGTHKNPATVGDGLKWLAVERKEVSGTESMVDIPSAYVTFKKKGADESLGIYLVSLLFYSNLTRRSFPDMPQLVELDGKTYEVFLRPKRVYKPATFFLHDFRFDRYIGTNKPRNYSSEVQIVAPESGEDRTTLIYMNTPLRYAGDTYYQSAFLEDENGTILQVVSNPGWLMPYISCSLVSIGMLIHFGMYLIEFLRRRAVA